MKFMWIRGLYVLKMSDSIVTINAERLALWCNSVPNH
jgi:hypothetical protein